MEQRKKEEKEFHDRLRAVADDVGVAETRWAPKLEKTIKNNKDWRNMKYYAIERKSRDFIKSLFVKYCKNAKVLDYCCGNGDDGFFIADNGADEVVGIDISEISISNCTETALKKGLSGIRHQVGDAENTGFADSSFDLVTEYGALHHLDLQKAYIEIARILKPNGVAICNEALRHNIIIHTYRKLTPDLRTEWEVNHILGKKEIDLAKKYFKHVEVYHFHLLTLLAVPFRNNVLFDPILKVLELLDRVLLKIPVIKWQAWQAVMVLSKPQKKS